MRLRALLVLLGATATADAQPARLDRIVAVVNDSVILQSELDARVAPLITQTANARELAAAVLSDMIDEELIVQAAVAAGLDVTEAELDAAIAEIKYQNQLDAAGLEQALEMQGYTIEAYKREIGRQLLRMRAVNQVIAPHVDATDRKARREALDRETARWTRRLRAQALIDRRL